MAQPDRQAEFSAERRAECNALTRALRDHVEAESDRGLRWVPKGGTQAPAAKKAEPQESAALRKTASAAPAPTAPVAAAQDPAVGAAQSIPALIEVLGECTRCKLAEERTNIVFGVGNLEADLMFVGEAPGRDEDREGEPFVGRAGQLLTEIITKGMKLQRADVYIANVVKCRPPGNRNPKPEEIAACMPFLVRQVQLIRPKVIVALGKFAAQTLLSSDTPITRMRGQWHEFEGIKVMPTLHPAYLLRNPSDKKLVWADIKAVMAELGLPA